MFAICLTFTSIKQPPAKHPLFVTPFGQLLNTGIFLYFTFQEQDVNVLERKINCGKIEEVIRQAERELHLARNMIQYKPWEPLIAEAPKNQFQWPPN